MNLPQIPIREATVEDAAAIARLLHDFNTEFEAETPGVEELTRHASRMLREGAMTAPPGPLYAKLGFTNEEGPDGATRLYYELEL
ncbi:MAG TPA: hypothetical protein VFS26_10545 [Solirubrobacterales bacterium]|nr:hypothetical protein [Solirubrobacterales bacterium]